MNQLIGFLLLALTVALALLLLGPVQFLLNPYALLLIFGCIFGVIFLSYGAQAFSIFRYANQPVRNQKEYFWVISFFDNLINTSILAGVIGSLIGTVTALTNITQASDITTAMSSSLVPILYGFVFAKFIFSPLKQNVLRRAKIANINANVQRQIEQNNKLAQQFTILGIVNFIGCFAVLTLTF